MIRCSHPNNCPNLPPRSKLMPRCNPGSARTRTNQQALHEYPTTMELVLNILWLLLAAGAITLWRTNWAHQQRVLRHAPWREWTAIVCALVLLFFVVSLTDDLHAEIVVLEECSNCRRHVNCLTAAHASQQPDHFPKGPGAAVIPASAHVADFIVAPLFVSTPQLPSSHSQQQSRSGRAPPITS
jgi:hypothetical protein